MQYLYFTADWCAPCKQLKPRVLDSGKSIQIIDIETHPEMKTNYNISSVPTLLGIKNGEVVERYNGSSQIIPFLNK